MNLSAITEVNSSAELLEKVQLLSQALENKTQELGDSVQLLTQPLNMRLIIILLQNS